MPFVRMRIPRAKLDVIAVEDVGDEASVASHYPSTGYPDDPSANVGIAINASLVPPRELALSVGDEIILETYDGSYEYVVMPPFDGHENPWTVDQLDFEVLSPLDVPALTVTTKADSDSPARRLILRLRLKTAPS